MCLTSIQVESHGRIPIDLGNNLYVCKYLPTFLVNIFIRSNIQIINCSITSRVNTPSVFVGKNSTDIIVQQCDICDSLNSGIILDVGSSCEITECSIARNKLASIFVKAKAAAKVNNCSIHSGRTGCVGIWVSSNAVAHIMDNHLFDNCSTHVNLF